MFSSNRSNTEVIHRSPNHTLGRTPCAFSSSGRVSVACSNSAILVSAHSCLPNRYGEFAPSATCSPAMACEAFQNRAKLSGTTCRWNCTLVHARVAHGRLAVAVHQVELDLQPGHRPIHVEARLGEHLREGVETAAHLLPESLPVRPSEYRRSNVLAHGSSVTQITCAPQQLWLSPLKNTTPAGFQRA